MDWWDRVSFPIADAAVEFICTPAQHNSGKFTHIRLTIVNADWFLL
jgi:hypothetical protein